MATLRITDDGDETIFFELDGKEVGTADHDDYGWAGMTHVINLVTAIAEAGGVTVENVQDIV